MSEHYIDNNEFEDLIVEHQANPTERTRKLLANQFMLLADNITNMLVKKYGKQPYWLDSEDQAHNAVVYCLERVDRYDQGKGKAFSYFTTVALNSFRATWRTENKYQSKKQRLDSWLNDL